MPDTRQKFYEVFSKFAEAQSYICLKRILSEEEIKNLRDCCFEFGVLFPKHFPGERIIPKMHEFIFHVPRFVEEHQTIGVFSEEEGESLHNIVNQEVRHFACMRGDKAKLSAVAANIEVRGKVDETYLKRKQRKCAQCSMFRIKGMCNCPL